MLNWHTPQGLTCGIQRGNPCAFFIGNPHISTIIGSTNTIVCRVISIRIQVCLAARYTQYFYDTSIVRWYPLSLLFVIISYRHIHTHREIQKILHVVDERFVKTYLRGISGNRFIHAVLNAIGIAAIGWQCGGHLLRAILPHRIFRDAHIKGIQRLCRAAGEGHLRRYPLREKQGCRARAILIVYRAALCHLHLCACGKVNGRDLGVYRDHYYIIHPCIILPRRIHLTLNR